MPGGVRDEGEFVLIIAPRMDELADSMDEAAAVGSVWHMTERVGLDLDAAIDRTAAALGRPPRVVKRAWKDHRYGRDRLPPS